MSAIVLFLLLGTGADRPMRRPMGEDGEDGPRATATGCTTPRPGCRRRTRITCTAAAAAAAAAVAAAA